MSTDLPKVMQLAQEIPEQGFGVRQPSPGICSQLLYNTTVPLILKTWEKKENVGRYNKEYM